MPAKDRKSGGKVTIIRREEAAETRQHSGAWKVAYADFVTAMMAFFLLMWLLNATTEAQRRGLADYFTPLNVISRNQSGSGQPFGGHTPYDDGEEASDKGAVQVLQGRAPPPPDEDTDGDMTAPTRSDSSRAPGRGEQSNGTGLPSNANGNAARETDQQGDKAPGGGVARADSQTPSKAEFLAHAGAGVLPKPSEATGAIANPPPGDPSAQTPQDPAAQTQVASLATADQAAASQAAADQQARARFEQAAERIRQSVSDDPSLADLGRQLSVDITPDGLRIQLLDEDSRPMFPAGSAALDQRARDLLRKVAPVLAQLPDPLILTGHTDATPYRVGDRSNWELSADRANATRRLLVEAGVPEDRFKEVAGRADRDPLLPADPMNAANRRIAIVVQHSFRAR